MPYYKTQKIFDKTWYISEPLGVGAFLFEGENSALLIDTCNGFVDIRKSIAKLTQKPLIVVNSHGHADHAGGNGQFKEVYIHEDDLYMLDPAWQQGQRDLLFGYAKKHYPVTRPLFWYLESRKFEKYEPNVKTFKDGHIFDIGGRKLQAIHFPGHSPGSVILTDAQTRTLFVGDAVNYGLFLFLDGSPELKEYAEKLRGLSKLSGFDSLRISHGKEPLPFDFIVFYADFLERVTLEKSTLTNIPNGEFPVYKYSENGGEFNLKEIAVHFRKDAIT
jgi:glyoxylase-like metal-dependent hydrolase (beta-lactamase superfamily II)